MRSARKITAVLLALMLLMGLAACGDSKESSGTADGKEEGKSTLTVKVGDTLELGTYEQDGNTANGTEAIVWQVLDIQDERALVISTVCLDVQPYHEESTYVTWENCSLREWLNGEFFDNAFSDKEKAQIPYVTVESEDNPQHNTYGGNNTVDRVFLLSFSEAQDYFVNAEALRCGASAYAAEKLASAGYVTDEGWVKSWTFRSPGKTNARLSGYGFYEENGLDLDGNSVTFDYSGVRPVMWVDYSGQDPEQNKPTGASTEIDAQTAEKQLSALAKANVGDEVCFGFYEIGNDPATTKEEIEWIVLDKQGDKLFVISKYILDQKNYHNEWLDVTWETCDLRKWLNGEFFTAAFTKEQQARIVAQTVVTPDHPTTATDGGNDTTDRVYLLSSDEAERYFDSDEARKALVTRYADCQNVETDESGHGAWWLRSPGNVASSAAYVRRTDGAVINYGFYVDGDGPVDSNTFEGVRPVMWISVSE